MLEQLLVGLKYVPLAYLESDPSEKTLWYANGETPYSASSGDNLRELSRPGDIRAYGKN